MADQIKTPKGLTLDRYLDMVRAGTHDAVAEMLRGESGSANADVVNAIKDGIAAATRAVVAGGRGAAQAMRRLNLARLSPRRAFASRGSCGWFRT